jgi:uncharacterized lipoprotein YbaY
MSHVRFALCLLALVCLSTTAANAQEGTPAAMLSRCAGKAGGDIRQGDPAFLTIALDGRPWVTIEETQEDVGKQPISTTITGTGWQQRRDGTSVPFRFTCVLDGNGQAVMFHASGLLHDLGDRLPPSIVINGAAAYSDKEPLPRGTELQVQVLDAAQQPARILSEQVVRSGWHVPVAFALRLPTATPLADRKLFVSARLVVAHRVLFELPEPRAVSPSDLQKTLDLTLSRVSTAH